ncbi:Gfo/Idh/MocA family protein [Aliiglaciecola litoralis]|uniref:Gfo/Idh/MocA-like oxidoreductase N-terminal domain-containing protein n=1 Tax=Aliiglaciecola litoralis TaxID=582857 RepID=A0ABN1LLA0_9ALTE
MNNDHIWLIGAGPMAIDYAKVLTAQNRTFTCITRSEQSAANFLKQTGIRAIAGGLQEFLQRNPDIPAYAIVATGVEMLSQASELLLKSGVKALLVEKPAGLDIKQVEQTQVLAKQCDAKVFVAYNRRFYASVIAAQSMIAEDGDIESLSYELTEWSHVIAKLDINDDIKENWFVANTSHVVDLAFFLGGKPKTLSAFTSGQTSWHKRSAVFAGSGVTDTNALFSYNANWNAPGRWSLEVSTPKRRYIFRPMELLQVQDIGSVAIRTVDIDLKYEESFKPGLYKQTEAFLNQETENLCSLSEHLINMHSYYRMAGYDNHDNDNDNDKTT